MSPRDMINVLWLAEQTWSVIVVYCWPITLVLVIAVLAALWKARRTLAQSPRRVWLLLSTPLFVPPVILLWGGFLRHTDEATDAPRWPIHVLNLLMVLSLVTFGWVIWRAVNLRWLALAVVLLSAWVGFWASFAAGMAIANDWL